MGLLQTAANCWRIQPARRIAFLVDTQAHFSAVRQALARARSSIFLLGWGFDPRTRLSPDGFQRPDDPDQIGHLLIALSQTRPELDIRLLIWRSALPVSASQDFFPHRARKWFAGTRIKFRLDDAVPFGACHHQKVLVIDDCLAFCGGGDFGADRWDTIAHLDADTRRIDPNQKQHAPRHEMAMMVDGPAAMALGDLARERWMRATGETLAAVAAADTPPGDDDPWPAQIRPDITDAPVAIVRTQPAWRGQAEICEWRRLTLDCIAQARRTLYMENQYFTSPVIAESLARRLAEPDGPQIMIVSAARSPSYFDQLTMDRTRALVIRRLREADVFGRFRAYCPRTVAGRPIIVHAKLTLVDDRLVRIGSCNLNNRSGGFDTECELAVEAKDAADEAVIRRLRHRLIGHYLGRSEAVVERAIARRGGLGPGVDALRHGLRLAPIEPQRLAPIARFIAAYHLGDPCGSADSWKIFRRRRRLEAEVAEVARAGQL
jgi:phosphatidylserine/phosphatidylglycerophosphate/cardiolipin synthase-like enzyme